ncbi:MAG: hypothetical protein Q8922_15825 [Bacteroidota bacterium]|nr:hypothetical protein [Bacteroidota bacterium]MDP4232752.1 hypothetical protein [Bacteroidota bacterium]MDP4242566.1 hypothetical protein [Bacteroidota bacterium]MDP4289383.1 hypothetical protein [Bacteroidota bacterium]
MTQKDIKLLWGRSGNRCAICRMELAQDGLSESSHYTLGEQAHIIGENESAARGTSIISEDDREGYHNRILLCPTDHTKIDSDEVSWPVEKLHVTKSRHELWVRETLGDSADLKLVAIQVAVTSIIDAAVELCRLQEWKNWTSFALPPDPSWDTTFPNMVIEFSQRVYAAIWPEEFEELKRATTTLSILLKRAIFSLMEHNERRGERYYAVRFYKSGDSDNPHYHEDVKRYDNWMSSCSILIRQATSAANWFADVVRRDINPMFFAERGKFMIIETAGITFFSNLPKFSEDEKAGLPGSLLEAES